MRYCRYCKVEYRDDKPKCDKCHLATSQLLTLERLKDFEEKFKNSIEFKKTLALDFGNIKPKPTTHNEEGYFFLATLIDGEFPQNTNRIGKFECNEEDKWTFKIASLNENHTARGKYNFVFHQNGITAHSKDRVGHYYLASRGNDVWFAGTVTFNNDGEITEWDNDSGHYRPAPQLAIQCTCFPLNKFRSVTFNQALNIKLEEQKSKQEKNSPLTLHLTEKCEAAKKIKQTNAKQIIDNASTAFGESKGKIIKDLIEITKQFGFSLDKKTRSFVY
ncbi:hypothetical protein MO867_21610 [Microbulbifer sp. OS29]|uniref:Uncharacterized protein n=1 Tax=Microbulbifer okhotskensis TaxID=2926617 RepID=A0A9X2J791_9GAMM|nr:hypothetical protein [Microbulbifer okhotskensis]MCO1336928.1 hypothetical protein [Microbulbifer okhotskensis]